MKIVEEQLLSFVPLQLSLNGKTKSMQKQALAWMKTQESDIYTVRGGILADEMGLGKTVEMISLILACPPPENKKQNEDCRRTTLIVCPTSTLSQWEDEINAKTGGKLSVYAYYGSKRVFKVKTLSRFDIVLTTFHTLLNEIPRKKKDFVVNMHTRRECGPLIRARWFRIVLDEAHMIKNPNGKITKAAFELNAERRWAMSGTPIQNAITDIWSLLKFLRAPERDIKGSASQFEKEIGLLVDENQSAGINKIKLILSNTLLRRTKDQKINGKTVLELPPITTKRIPIKLSENEALFYRSLFEQAQDHVISFAKKGTIVKNFMAIFELLLRLRQACNHPFIVLMCMPGTKEGKYYGNYEMPSKVFKDSLESLKNGNLDAMNSLVRGLGHDSHNLCGICGDALMDPVTLPSPCGHTYCKLCIQEWSDKNTDSHCPLCRMVNEAEPSNESVAIAVDDSIDVKAEEILDESGDDAPLDTNDDGRYDTKEEYIRMSSKSIVKKEEQLSIPSLESIPLPSSSSLSPSLETLDESRTENPVSNVKEEVASEDTNNNDSTIKSEVKEEAKQPQATDGNNNSNNPNTPSPIKISESWFHYKVASGETVSLRSEKSYSLLQELEMERRADPKAKSVIFSQFTMYLDMLEILLNNAKFKFERLDGRMTRMERERSIRSFRTNDEVTVFVISLKAGGVGLNLTEASNVFMMDPWWNPAVERQAIDRVHRFGQKKKVKVIYFTTRDTIEESMLELQESKSAIATLALGDVAFSSFTRIRERDLKRIFRITASNEREN
eukprot:TRINITY_DN3283_c0_g1_i2.p1 TRINITY_DN3283_c0_g1~~TRINITY_DN3283_c0_g1_i2.p1  ORF type:complete len:784 (+),score=275.75 TRINITY_DN3283_c0_g1_i2:1039-3390(+)